jgi:hypothetical protein
MNSESQEVERLFGELCEQTEHPFPQNGKPDVPLKQGVYIIRKEDTVLHVGRTRGGKDGLCQRLNNHLHGSSSFVKNYPPLDGKGVRLREDGYKFQYLEVEDRRERIFLESYATGVLCPEYIGLGE